MVRTIWEIMKKKKKHNPGFSYQTIFLGVSFTYYVNYMQMKRYPNLHIHRGNNLRIPILSVYSFTNLMALFSFSAN